MKKLLVLSALILASCAHENQKVQFDISLPHESSNAINGVKIEVVAFDDRAQKDIYLLGSKKFGEEKIEINTDQNVAELLRGKISDNLVKKGFQKGKDKVVEVHLESLQYKAERKFFIGTSQGDIAVKIIVKNMMSGERFTKNFALAVNGKHFLAPLKSTDDATLNALVQDVMVEILNDQSFLRALYKSF